jgi:hypothetical protein
MEDLTKTMKNLGDNLTDNYRMMSIYNDLYRKNIDTITNILTKNKFYFGDQLVNADLCYYDEKYGFFVAIEQRKIDDESCYYISNSQLKTLIFLKEV